MKLKNRSDKSSGFTLMEMLIVISIISILLGLLYGALERAQKFSRRAMAYTELKNIETSFKQYYAHYNMWPPDSFAQAPLTSGNDTGFIIDREMAYMLQGVRAQLTNPDDMDNINPEAIPFIEFARFSTVEQDGPPVNPFKSINNTEGDTTRAYHVLFDSDGDGQIIIPQDDMPEGVTAPDDPIIATVIVWTYIPAVRTTDNQGNENSLNDALLGSWESFAAK